MTDYRRIFTPDSGTLLDIVVLNVSLDDWQRLLNFVSKTYLTAYSEDGERQTMPDVSTIFANRLKRSITWEILLPGFTLNCHFFVPQVIELDLLPNEVDSNDKAEAVFAVMRNIADCLGKRVFLVPESSGSDDQIRDSAICVAESDGSFTYLT